MYHREKNPNKTNTSKQICSGTICKVNESQTTHSESNTYLIGPVSFSADVQRLMFSCREVQSHTPFHPFSPLAVRRSTRCSPENGSESLAFSTESSVLFRAPLEHSNGNVSHCQLTKRFLLPIAGCVSKAM